MQDYESTNIDAAAHLAREADFYPPERPSRFEQQLDETEMRRWGREEIKRERARLRNA